MGQLGGREKPQDLGAERSQPAASELGMSTVESCGPDQGAGGEGVSPGSQNLWMSGWEVTGQAGGTSRDLSLRQDAWGPAVALVWV